MNKKLLTLTALFAMMSLCGCDSLPTWMGGTEKPKEKLPGERITVLPVEQTLKPDDTLKNTPVTLPAPVENVDWPEHSGGLTAATSNLAVAGNLTHIEKATIGEGEPYSSHLLPRPVVAGGLVFAMDAVGNISAHDAANITNIRWKSKGVREEDGPEIFGGGLTINQGKLYVVSGRGAVAALDAASGKLLWRKELRIPFRSAPKVSGDKLLATTIDNQIFAFNVANGDTVWNDRGIDETAGLLASVSPASDGDTVVVPYSSGELYGVSLSDGKVMWNDTLSANLQTQATVGFAGIGGDPVIDGEVVFAVSSGGSLSVINMLNGQPIWDHTVSSVNSPWVSGDYIFLLASDNTLVCFMKYTGAIRWAVKLPDFADMEKKKDPIIWKGPVLINGKLAIVGSRGELAIVSGTEGKILEVLTIPEEIYTAPVVAAGRMYLVDKDATLYSLQ